jgi:enamine deaminase RidA (YjgF/YER057c/UK114 family)
MVDYSQRGRIAVDLVDGEDLYFSRFVTAGPYVFMSSLAVNEHGAPESTSIPEPPYHLSPAAHANLQTTFIYQRYVDCLPELGASIQDVVQIEQFMPWKKYGDAYTETSRSKGFLDRKRPTSANIQTGDLFPDYATVAHTGIAVSPSAKGFEKKVLVETDGYSESLTDTAYGDTFVDEGPFSEVITAGPYIFTVGDTAIDWSAHDIHADAKLDDIVWWGSEIRNETEFVLKRLESYLKRAGAGLDDIVHMTVYLTDIGDLFEHDRVWRRLFKSDPPARTVLPVRGLGIPAFEGGAELHHKDRAVRLEQMSQSLVPGAGYEREIVRTDRGVTGFASEAIKAGPLLWTSELMARDAEGKSTAEQLDEIFAHLAELSAAAGTSVDRAVRLRAFFTDVEDAPLFYQVLRQHFPSEPPTVAVSAVPGPLHVPGATVLLDAVVYVPESA